MENRFRAFINYLFSVLGLTLWLLICRKIHNSNFSSFSNLSFPKPNHWKFIHNVGYHKIQDKFDFWLYNRLGIDHLTCRGGYGFLFRSEIFFQTTQELEYLFFFQNSTLGYMTKTLNQIIFFCLHQNQNIFFSNTGNQNIFLEKNHIHVYIAFEVKLPLVV